MSELKRLSALRHLIKTGQPITHGTVDGAELLGDKIAKITTAIGIKPCGGCKARQKWLNEKDQQTRKLAKKVKTRILNGR